MKLKGIDVLHMSASQVVESMLLDCLGQRGDLLDVVEWLVGLTNFAKEVSAPDSFSREEEKLYRCLKESKASKHDLGAQLVGMPWRGT